MDKELLIKILGILLIISGFLNGRRYYWSAKKIIEAKTSKGHSRKSANVAIMDDLIRLSYGIIRLDLYFISSAIFTLIFTIHKWIIIYKFYPFKKRGLRNFKRPSIFKYFINSLIPNKKRKKL